jgi:hypothetical protein
MTMSRITRTSSTSSIRASGVTRVIRLDVAAVRRALTGVLGDPAPVGEAWSQQEREEETPRTIEIHASPTP